MTFPEYKVAKKYLKISLKWLQKVLLVISVKNVPIKKLYSHKLMDTNIKFFVSYIV